MVEDLSDMNRKFLNPVKTFEDAFQHYPDILSQIQKQGFEKPSPIQVRKISERISFIFPD